MISLSSHLSKRFALCELAPFQPYRLTVAGFHRAHPSTSLDKSDLYLIKIRLSVYNAILVNIK